ncbi:hypothetical protein Riv7116_0981 [Rivularia sp. PCC 7116]|uniref:hypothetical protein n=1 Tax=Rivularia sp. PCC 7116 TaxID=373994 RepID=UPI00029EE6A2|nr:hypothetical protein [Rivularia sp. PCC 7116]AFY53556.1 hypothetical protein Riv7116_0981 [Rivularia sp. PCC 7116]
MKHLDTIDDFFGVEHQLKYVALLKGKVGLTRRRAECFVKLWAYLLLKQHQELGIVSKAVTELDLPEGFVACTHREANELFYAEQDRGSERAAGMMIDKLVALGLIEKEFDGNNICIRICSPLSDINESAQVAEPVELVTDNFNPRTDTIPVATFLARQYDWMNKKTTAVPQIIARKLRNWAKKYSKGMRVLRRCDTQHPIGVCILYPVASESEENFFLPPSKSLHLSTASQIDPFEMAEAGDEDCTSLFIRSFRIDSAYLQHSSLHQLLEDARETLINMQADFPNLCDLYTLTIDPFAQSLALAMGFQETGQDSQVSLYWMYMALDKYLTLDIEQALSNLKLD